MRTNLQFSGPQDSQRVLLITSPEPEDGKSAVAINMAYTLAHGGQKVLLIDCNFRRPSDRRIGHSRGFFPSPIPSPIPTSDFRRPIPDGWRMTLPAESGIANPTSAYLSWAVGVADKDMRRWGNHRERERERRE